MDKKAIKTFAIESRKKLIEEVKYQASLLGITAEGITDPVEKAEGMEVYDIGLSTPYKIYEKTIDQRKDLVRQVEEKGFDNVVEEVAYTWFNRLIAIRYMEVNDYLPTRVRVLSSLTEGKIEPDIITEALNLDLDLTDKEFNFIFELKSNNKLDELFRFLFIKQCNKLNEVLPELFEKTADYTELLLSISFTNEDGVIRQLVENISEDDFTDQVEIIGWLYQYYNTELKEETFKLLKKGIKISKERIPAATQLFTPDWIVRYMIENSLGRLWLEGNPNSDLKENWKYYLDDAEQELEVQIELAKISEDFKNIRPEDIKIIDPAIGSGHIIIRAFDILMEIYTSVGYNERDAAVLILENNIYGLDIDDRAYQLAFFAVMMKARAYNKNILKKTIEPKIYAIKESNGITDDIIKFIAKDNIKIKKDLNYLVKKFLNAKNYGSVIDVDQLDFNSTLDRLDEICTIKFQDFKSIKYQKEVTDKIYPIVKQAIILSMSFDIVVTNPPYMGYGKMNKDLSSYLRKNFPDSKNDLFAVFIERCQNMVSENRFLAMITQHAFMFLSGYEELRKKVLNNTIMNMIHLGSKAFEEIGGEVVQTTSFTIQNNLINKYHSKYSRLVDYNSQDLKEKAFLSKNNVYIAKQENFTRIPRNPFAYWLNNYKIFDFNKVGKEYVSGGRNKTHNNPKFVRKWWEVDFTNKKWELYSNGGDFRKWYGNDLDVVDWSPKAREAYDSHGGLCNKKFWYKRGICWNLITSYKNGFRIKSEKAHYSSGSPTIFNKDFSFDLSLLGFLNSEVAAYILRIFNPTLNTTVSDVLCLPLSYDKYNERISNIVSQNISISKRDWDNFEKSIDFKCDLLIKFGKETGSLKIGYDNLEKYYEKLFSEIKFNEEELNRIFIKIYAFENEISDTVLNKDITLFQININNVVKNYISYAVGCMFGRYSLDEEGLIFAGGQWDPSKYSQYAPDEDNIIPILDTEYFEDDIIGRFVEFVKTTFSEETLEENLDFIAKALKKRGNTSREVIKNYFLTDFYKDHCNSYASRNAGKRPIYWQFDSGRNNGFKALIYMHRYVPDIVARVRKDYLHKTQKALEEAIGHNERIIESSTSASEKTKAVKAKNKLVKQLDETRKYDEALAHVANQKIEIDLDDGVKVNYTKFQGVEVSSEGQKAKKINLLKTI